MYDPNQNPYAAPSSNLHDSHGSYDGYVTEQVMLAPRMSRLAAILLDSFIAGLIAMPFFVIIGLTGGFDDNPNEIVLAIGMIAMMIAVLCFAVYNLFLLHKSGQTIGKKLMKIKIVRSDLHTRADLPRIIFLRYAPMSLLGAIPIIGSLIQIADYLFIFGTEQRCLHDRIADTHVVMVTEPTQFATQAAANW